MTCERIAVLIKTASIEFDKMANPILADYNLTASQCRVLKFCLCSNIKAHELWTLKRSVPLHTLRFWGCWIVWKRKGLSSKP